MERRLRDIVVRALRSSALLSFVVGLEALLEGFAQVLPSFPDEACGSGVVIMLDSACHRMAVPQPLNTILARSLHFFLWVHDRFREG